MSAYQLNFINKLNKQFENASLTAVLQYCSQQYGNTAIFATSLGLEDQIITHELAMLRSRIRMFTLDTGRLFPETYDVLYRTQVKYGIKIEIVFPEREKVEEMVNTKGINLFYDSVENRKQCCNVRKIMPLKRMIKGANMWICGLRRDQSVGRKDTKLFEWDDNYNIIKVSPLVLWTENQVKEFVDKNNIPFNSLHKRNYPSIGCAPCTQPVIPGEDIRNGRWWWENDGKKECGLHTRK